MGVEPRRQRSYELIVEQGGRVADALRAFKHFSSTPT